ncbi:MAG: ATP-binding cassette domain-containing protein, partial [Gammaproteobacteria bacterium]|nr:ATP-binding cassette domain-containing protein [Gammaproteobacteria bacterium]
MSTGQSLLEVGDLTVSFDGFKALNALSFVMYEGQLTVIIGPNGAGKTTLLDVVTGRTRADTGSIVFDGHDIAGLADYRIARLGVGRKFQTPSVFPDLTVMENLTLAGRRSKSVFGTLFRRASADDRARLDDVLHTIGLEQRSGDAAGALSHGERQWLEIGMVLAQRPKLML